MRVMGDDAHHTRLSKEKREAALEEHERRRYSAVGDLTIKAVEQAIEAAAYKEEGKHFHLRPRTAHAERTKWAKEKFPPISKDLDVLWGTYGILGYEGADGDRARKAVEAMERIMDEISNRIGIRLK